MITRRKYLYPALRGIALLLTALVFVLNAGALAAAIAAHPFEIALVFSLLALLLSLDESSAPLDVAIYALAFAAFGWTITALLAFGAYVLAYGTGKRYSLRERVLVGAARVPLWIAFGLIAALWQPQLAAPGARAFADFALFNAAWIAAAALFAGDRARRCTNVRFWVSAAGQLLWGYVATQIFIAAGPWLGIASLVPLAVIAGITRRLHRETLASHRKTLARDAVWQMLQSRDPATQINSFLASVHGDAPQETMQIYVRVPNDDRALPLACVGHWPGEERMPLVRRALLELYAHDKDSVSVRDDEGVVTAFAVRAARVLGALVVHRPAGISARITHRRYLTIADELAPLLRDVRSVAAARDAASIDSLTGLLNRASIMTHVREQLAHVSPGTGCALLLIDVDNFKDVNDRLGHLAGDRCLRAVGETIARNIRPGDRAGRIGGEEFLVLMRVEAEIAAIGAGERLRAAIETCGVTHADGAPVTASIGVAAANVADTPETLLGRADRALYQAKNAGRNRVIEIA